LFLRGKASTPSAVPPLVGVNGFAARLLPWAASATHCPRTAAKSEQLDCSGKCKGWAENGFARGPQSLFWDGASVPFSRRCVHYSHQTYAGLRHMNTPTSLLFFPLSDGRREHKTFFFNFTSGCQARAGEGRPREGQCHKEAMA